MVIYAASGWGMRSAEIWKLTATSLCIICECCWKGQSRHLHRQKVCSMGRCIFTSRYMCRFVFFSFRLLILKDRNFLFLSRENDDVYSGRQTKIFSKYTASLRAMNWCSQCKIWVDEREIERDEIHNGQNIILKLDAIYNPIESDNEC